MTKRKRQPSCRKLSFLLAQTVGFEPTVLFTVQTISSRSRYDHFDTSANKINNNNIIHFLSKFVKGVKAKNLRSRYKKRQKKNIPKKTEKSSG